MVYELVIRDLVVLFFDIQSNLKRPDAELSYFCFSRLAPVAACGRQLLAQTFYFEWGHPTSLDRLYLLRRKNKVNGDSCLICNLDDWSTIAIQNYISVSKIKRG